MRHARSEEVKEYLRARPVTELLLNRVKGGDITQERVHFYNFTIACVYGRKKPSDEEWGNAWSALTSVTKATAFRILAYLPDPLINTAIAVDEKELLKRLKHPHFAVSAWLLYWDKQGNLEDLMQNGLAAYQPYALFSKRRWDLIQGLFDLGRIPNQIFHRPAFAWLLAEISICISRLGYLGIQYQSNYSNLTSKREVYDLTKKHINELEDLDRPLEVQQPEHFQEILEHFNAFIEIEAKAEAQVNEVFNLQYYKPYVDSFKAYNVARQTNSSLVLLSNSIPKRRGPQIAEKSKGPKLQEIISKGGSCKEV